MGVILLLFPFIDEETSTKGYFAYHRISMWWNWHINYVVYIYNLHFADSITIFSCAFLYVSFLPVSLGYKLFDNGSNIFIFDCLLLLT